MYAAAVFLPLLGAMVSGLFGLWIKDRAALLVTCLCMVAASLLSIAIFLQVAVAGQSRTVEIFTWIASGSFDASWALRYDTLSAVMVLTVNVVSTAIHIYSVGYMAEDRSIPRFMAYLSLFTFFMLALVTADNFVQMFFGWEGVGLVSYLLVGFWYDRPTANAAAIKAFVVNRVGDFGFALGIAGVFLVFGSVNFETVFASAPEKASTSFQFLGVQVHAMTALCLLLFVGAMGKSAQLGLHTWLPDAMEGPTPVSALIHAATMVTAGVFMVARLSPLFELAPVALSVVAIVGASTALFAASVALVQNDIKRVVAYSTCSQLGFMFFGAGVSAYAAAIFHLMTHAYFKALLFLGAGSVIHAMSGEQDMRKMGGLRTRIPYTYWLMWIGSLSLAGIPPLAGYFSKDTLLEAAFGAGTAAGQYAFWLGICACVMTAFYSGRLLFLTFHGEPRMDARTRDHIHESPLVMLLPVAFLAIGAIAAGWVGYWAFVGEGRAGFWRESIKVLAEHDALDAVHHSPLWVAILPTAAAIVGLGLAYGMYIRDPDWPRRLAERFRGLHAFLLNKWYFDEFYDRLLVRPSWWLGLQFWKKGDGLIIDGFGPDGVAATTVRVARQASLAQTGYVYHYAFAMLIGVVLLVAWYLLGWSR